MSSKRIWTEEDIAKLVALRTDDLTWDEIAEELDDVTPNSARKAYYRYMRDDAKPRGNKTGPKVLIFDIETTPMEVYAWGLFDQNIGLEMIKEDWSVLSWSAKWLGAPASEVMYRDQRNKKNIRDDKDILESIRELLDEADVVITQNGIKFDSKKLNARFVMNQISPPSSYKHIDTLRIAKAKFGFTSNKLAYMTDKLCVKYKKLDHNEFAGAKLWVECLKHNPDAFKAMEKYNKYDVLSLEELYVDHLAKWDDTLNFAAYSDEHKFRCNCGSDKFEKNGYYITKKSKFQKYKCSNCGKEHRDSANLFSAARRAELKV